MKVLTKNLLGKRGSQTSTILNIQWARKLLLLLEKSGSLFIIMCVFCHISNFFTLCITWDLHVHDPFGNAKSLDETTCQ